MNEQDLTALIAILVSLLALLIALVQLLQQYFGTAEGYRRCRGEVIGPWAAQTHRHFVLTELRYETKFTVPDIDLRSAREHRDMCMEEKEKYGRALHSFVPPLPNGPFLLVSQEPPEMIDLTIHPNKQPKHTSSVWRFLPQRAKYAKLNEGVMVSWIPFLRELHESYKHHYGHACTCQKQGNFMKQPSIQTLQNSKPDWWAVNRQRLSDSRHEDTSLSRTDVSIIYREMSWDFMPADVVRPPAITHLGALAVFAMRLGMRWQNIRIGRDDLQASGNGYSLSSTGLRALGYVVQFSRDAGVSTLLHIIPSQPADKIICGRLPGDDTLIKRDFNIVDDNGKTTGIREVLQALRVATRATEFLTNPELLARCQWYDSPFRRTGFNDLVPLIAPFMPLVGTSSHSLQYLGWIGMEPLSVFTMWEGRLALFQRITEDQGRWRESRSPNSWFEYALQQFTYLEREGNYLHRYFYRYSGAPLIFSPGLNSEMIEDCRAIWEKTQAFFLSLQNGVYPSIDGDTSVENKSSSSSSGQFYNMPRLEYSEILGAHCEMAVNASFEARDRYLEAEIKVEGKKVGKKTKHVVEWRPAWQGPNMHKESFKIGLAYVDSVAHPEKGGPWYSFTDKMRIRLRRAESEGKGQGMLSDEQIKAIWWMLMLKGVCWSMSVYIRRNEDVIPSLIYDNRTPIWIT